MIITDSFYTIGSSHSVCEDYCLTGSIAAKNSFNNYRIDYGILSDGCSQQTHTDVGARILVHNFASLLNSKSFQERCLNINEHSQVLHDFIGGTRSKAAAFINSRCLDCTFCTFLINDENCIVSIVGDGCLFLQKKTGEIESIIIDCEHNAPMYLNYDENDLIDYKRGYGSWKVFCTEYLVGKKEISKKQDSILLDDSILKFPLFKRHIKLGDYKTIMICSDGAASFLKGNVRLVNVEDIARILLTLPKDLKINYMQQHMANIKKECERQNWDHYDDFSVIVGTRL